MDVVDKTIPRMTTDGLEVILGGRIYGDTSAPDYLSGLMQMDIPPELGTLRDVLVRDARLLTLGEGPTRDGIYDAYGHDLQMLERYRTGFKICIDAAVQARANTDDQHAQEFLGRVIEQIAPIEHQSVLKLDMDALDLEPDALVCKLQEEFRRDVENLARNVAFWLHLLAESQMVSLIEWRADRTALRYHFFRMDHARKEAGKKVEVTGDHIIGTTTTTTTEHLVRVFNERHVHVVVKARSRTPQDYTGAVPERIAKLIDAIPPEIRQFVTIVDGQVTNREVHRRLVAEKTEVEMHSEFRPDPAITLFETWAIGGWAEEKARSWYRDHPRKRADLVLVGSLVATAAFALLGFASQGLRGGGGALVIGLILTLASQIGMRMENKKRVQ